MQKSEKSDYEISFDCVEWLSGDITTCKYGVQGVFINICAYYRCKNGLVSFSQVKQKFKNVPAWCFDELKNKKILKIDEKKDSINIVFIDEQLSSKSKKNIVKNYQQDFIDKIINEFKLVYERERNTDYFVTNNGIERSIAGKLLEIFKKRFPDLNSDQILKNMSDYFTMCVNINDSYLNHRMTLPFLYANINKINSIIKNGKNANNNKKQRETTTDLVNAVKDRYGN